MGCISALYVKKIRDTEKNGKRIVYTYLQRMRQTRIPLWNCKYLRSNRRGPVTVAERSKACTVFDRSEAGIVRSNPTQGMDV
jgi:hypothetical protein